MKIDNKNKQIINTGKVSMHDDIITNFTFNRMKRILELKIKDGWNNHKEGKIEFINVIGFEMSSCNYWGQSSRVSGIYCNSIEEYKLIPRLFKTKYDNPSWKYNELLNEEDYIEVLVEFISGDTLTIACEYIDFKK